MECLERWFEKLQNKRYGKYRGIVTDNQDPENLSRIRASVPEVFGKDLEIGWALPCVPYAGNDSGIYMVPESGDSVWIEFEAGDVSRPIWSGCWWGESQKPPEDESGGIATPPLKIIRSEKGLMVAMDDSRDMITLSDQSGSDLIRIEAQKGQIKIKGAVKVVIEAPEIELVENAMHSVVLGDQLLQYLTKLVAIYQSHVHPDQLAGDVQVTPAPPVPLCPPPSPAVLSTRVKVG